MENTVLKELATWAVVLALPVWLVVEEILHRLSAFTASKKVEAPRKVEARPAPTGHRGVEVDGAHAA